MTAGMTRVAGMTAPRRRRLILAMAAVGAWCVTFTGLAPAATAEDVSSQQWYLGAMKAEEMWKVSTGEGIKVAVVDSGVNSSTDSLRGQVLPGKDVTKKPGDATDDYSGHGTTIAELIVGTGKSGGIKGLAPGAQVIPIRATLTQEKASGVVGDTSKAIRAAADSDARIINMALGSEVAVPADKEAIEYAVKKGKLVFIAVGNDGEGENKTTYPASFPGAIGVGAVDESAKAAKFSQHGSFVDLTAPGADIPQWCSEDFQKYCADGRGTSMSAAIASASAALIWSEHPDWTANQVLRVMIETASKPKDGEVPSTHLGYGVVRPRMVLLEGKGDPGEPGQNPLSKSEPSESAEPSQSSEDKNGEKNAADKVEVADSAESDEDSQLWIILGSGAAVAVLAAGTFAFVRMRRS